VAEVAGAVRGVDSFTNSEQYSVWYDREKIRNFKNFFTKEHVYIPVVYKTQYISCINCITYVLAYTD